MQYMDAEHTLIETPLGVLIPAEVGNRDYDEIIASGVEIQPYAGPSLDEVKAAALSFVDSEFNRHTFVEPGVLETRRLKREEAEEILENGSDDDAVNRFPLIAASMADGESVEDTAERIYGAFKSDEQSLARMEGVRLKAKATIREAGTAKEVEQVRASLSWGQ